MPRVLPFPSDAPFKVRHPSPKALENDLKLLQFSALVIFVSGMVFGAALAFVAITGIGGAAVR